ncbi:hypothetical protein HF086_016710 [Spodoptera exigua]|uniref:Uncharacterized protein n=1 Tax=Spodoptera exigua TaxID=7107 RepID=A0A922MV67_SPOEX|nr:hypothetical protein HF086_016710 [Spodoptera exigua]
MSGLFFRNRVLAGLYMGRSDVALMVLPASAACLEGLWIPCAPAQVVVTNTARRAADGADGGRRGRRRGRDPADAVRSVAGLPRLHQLRQATTAGRRPTRPACAGDLFKFTAYCLQSIFCKRINTKSI